jgi:Autographiviridae endonuclease VII
MSRPPAETKLIDGKIYKQCSVCDEFKFIEEFGFNLNGYMCKKSKCRVCEAESSRKFRSENLEHYKNYRAENKERITKQSLIAARMRRYGITDDQFQEMAKTGCEACGTYENLCVDHDHITNEVRGILCAKCNQSLGLLGEDVSRILRLAEYLERKNHFVVK